MSAAMRPGSREPEHVLEAEAADESSIEQSLAAGELGSVFDQIVGGVPADRGPALRVVSPDIQASEVVACRPESLLSFWDMETLAGAFLANRWDPAEETQILVGIARGLGKDVTAADQFRAMDRLRKNAFLAARMRGFLSGPTEATATLTKTLPGGGVLTLQARGALPRPAVSETEEALLKALGPQPLHVKEIIHEPAASDGDAGAGVSQAPDGGSELEPGADPGPDPATGH